MKFLFLSSIALSTVYAMGNTAYEACLIATVTACGVGLAGCLTASFGFGAPGCIVAAGVCRAGAALGCSQIHSFSPIQQIDRMKDCHGDLDKGCISGEFIKSIGAALLVPCNASNLSQKRCIGNRYYVECSNERWSLSGRCADGEACLEDGSICS